VPIPTASDARLSHVRILADGIATQIKIIEHAGEKDRPRMLRGLRERIDAYADAAMEAGESAGKP
jgi:hypothetical protein